MWELDYKESWVQNNWCFWTVVLEKTLESPLDCKEIQPVHPEGDQSWVFIGRTDFEATSPILWPPDAKRWLLKRPWCWERLGAGGEGDDRGWDGWMASPTQWTWVWVDSGFGDGQGGLACWSSWGCKESDTTERLNWTETRTNPSGKQTEVIEERREILLLHTFEQPLDSTYGSDRSPKVSIFFLPVPEVGRKTLVDTLMYISVIHWINLSFKKIYCSITDVEYFMLQVYNTVIHEFLRL